MQATCRCNGDKAVTWPGGTSETAALIRRHDWAATSLGPAEQWPDRLKAVIDLMLASPLVSTIALGDDRLFLYNDAAAGLYGDRHPTALGKPLATVFADSYPSVAAFYDKVFAGESVTVKAQPLPVGTDGGGEVFDAYLTPVCANGESVIGAHMVGIEMGDQIRTGAALRESEERFRNMADHGPAMIWVTDASGYCTYLNRAWYDFTGQTIEEAEGFGWLDATHPDDKGEAERIFLQANAKQESFRIEYRLRRFDDVYHWAIDAAAPRLDAQGNFLGFVGSVVDIHERREAEERLRQDSARQDFLLRLADAIWPMEHDEEIMATAARLLGEHLDVERVGYGELDAKYENLDVKVEWRVGEIRTAVGRQPLAAYGAELIAHNSAGRSWVIEDVDSDPRQVVQDARERYREWSVQAAISIPLIQRDHWVASLYVNTGQPRSWSEGEVLLVRDVAERTWTAVERARVEVALREREAELARTQHIGEIASFDIDLVGDATGHRSPEYCRMHGLEPRIVGENQDDWLTRVHPDDRESAQQTFLAGLKKGGAYESEYRIIRRSDGAVRWISARGIFEPDAEGNNARLLGAHIDITDRKRVETALREIEARWKSLVEGMPQLVWRAIAVGSWTWASPQWTEYTGQSDAESHSQGWLEPVHPDDREATLKNWAEAEAKGIFEADYRLFHHAEQRYRWFQTRALPVREEDGSIIEWLGTSTDVDDMRAMQDRQQIMVAELQHRTRNLLAVVNATMSSTIRDSEDLKDFASLFRHRLHALSRVNALLSRRKEGERIAFDELIRMELAGVGAFDSTGYNSHIELNGPDGVQLRSRTVQTFALAIHELATNALKYGALSQRSGKLSVRWKVVEDRTGLRLHVTWLETGVVMPEQGQSLQGTGYGRELIERALPYQLQAETYYEVRPDGICCTIEMPIVTNGISHGQ